MKKNLITVLILALSVINLVLNVILFFVLMPSAAKTNKLIGDISEVLDIELESQKKEHEGDVDVSKLETFKLEMGNPINLLAKDSNLHALQYGMSLELDTTNKDFGKTKTTLEQSTSAIFDMTRDVIGQYTYEEVINVDTQREIKEKLLAQFKEYFGTECIYSISFYNWVAQ